MAVFMYGLVCYAIFFGTFLYLIGFVENLVVPKSVDTGSPGPVGPTILIDLALIAVLAAQHTIMARPAFKQWWTRYVPRPMERSTFVLATCAVLALLFWQWRPIAGALWHVDQPIGRAVLYGLSFAGWGLVLYSSVLIDHFDLFGLRQVWFHLRRREYHHPTFQTPWVYRLVRNPLMLGFLLAFWSAPTMTWGRLIFALGTTAYILFGIQVEERDLMALLGEPYRDFRRRTPMLLPWPRPRASGALTAFQDSRRQ